MRQATDRALVLVTESLDEEAFAWLAERCDVRRARTDEPGFATLLTEAHGLVVRTYTRVDAAFLEGAPKLRVVGRAGVGLDNIDVEMCRARGVEVVHTPDANTRAVVELVLAFMLDALRPRVYLAEALKIDAWEALRKGLIAPRQLHGLTLGILGLGRVGKRLAAAGSAIGMRVIYHDLLQIEAHRFGAVPVSRDELLAKSDVVTIHVDGRASNRHLIGAEAFTKLKPEALFINASRGFVVDGAALAQWLAAHPGAMACCDVHEPEPVPAGHPLLGVANARLTPHIGAATAEAHRAMSWVVRDVWRVLQGEVPEHPAAAPIA